MAGWSDWQTVWTGTQGQHVDWSYAIGASKYDYGAREYSFRWRLYGFDKPMRVKYRYTKVTNNQTDFEDGEAVLKPNGEIHREMGDWIICNQIAVSVENRLLPLDVPDNSPTSTTPRTLNGINSTIADDGSTPPAKSPAARQPVTLVKNSNRFTIPGGYCPPAAANPGVNNNAAPMTAAAPAPAPGRITRSSSTPTVGNRAPVNSQPVQNNAPVRNNNNNAPIVASGGSSAPVRRNNPPAVSYNPPPVVRATPAPAPYVAPAPQVSNYNANVNAHNERVQEQLNSITQRIQSNNAASANINSQMEALKNTIMQQYSSGSSDDE